MDVYTGIYEIRWSDLDANGHVNYAAYIDAAGDLRYRFFTEHGFPPQKFVELGMGPIYTDIHAQFLREVRLGETVTITYALADLSARGGRWRVHHDVLKTNGKRAVSIDLEGTILDLTARKAALPPPELAQVFSLSRTQQISKCCQIRCDPDKGEGIGVMLQSWASESGGLLNEGDLLRHTEEFLRARNLSGGNRRQGR